MKRITELESKQFIPLKENYNDTSVSSASTFTITPSDRGDGWEDVTYFTARKRNMFSGKGEGDQWVYVLSNPVQPGIYKIGYTKLTPDERAKQISNATGRVNSQREFFQIDLDMAISSIKLIGKDYIS